MRGSTAYVGGLRGLSIMPRVTSPFSNWSSEPLILGATVPAERRIV